MTVREIEFERYFKSFDKVDIGSFILSDTENYIELIVNDITISFSGNNLEFEEIEFLGLCIFDEIPSGIAKCSKDNNFIENFKKYLMENYDLVTYNTDIIIQGPIW